MFILQMSPVEEEDDPLRKQLSSLHARSHSSDEDLTQNLGVLETEKAAKLTAEQAVAVVGPRFEGLSKSLPNLEIPERNKWLERQDSANLERTVPEEEGVPEESILKRINSRKGMESYQLGKQLSCRWTTGAGPRIGCVRDYPSELQFRALEQVNLSPRSAGRSRSHHFSPRTITGFSPTVSTLETMTRSSSRISQPLIT